MSLFDRIILEAEAADRWGRRMAGRVARGGKSLQLPPPKQATYKRPDSVPMSATSTWTDQQRRRVKRQGPLGASIDAYSGSLLGRLMLGEAKKGGLTTGDYVTTRDGQGGYVQAVNSNGVVAIRVVNQPSDKASIIYVARENLNIRPGE